MENQTQTTVNEKIEIITEEGLIKTFEKFLKIFPSVISIIVGFTTFAYIIGWFHARSYYSGFNAPWMVSKLSNTEIITFSWVSISQLMFFIFLGITDLMTNKTGYKTTFFILKNGWRLIVIVTIIDIILLHLDQWKTLINLIGVIEPILFTAYAASAFELLLIVLQRKDHNWGFKHIHLTFIIVGIGFYFLPTKIGWEESLRDSDINKSTLSKIFVVNDDSSNLRLLRVEGELFYIVALDSLNNTTKIKVVNYKQVKFIE